MNRTFSAIHDQVDITAAIDGMSDCPGEPCDTSIPRIRVGLLDTTGIIVERSTAKNEFNPPSCK